MLGPLCIKNIGICQGISIIFMLTASVLIILTQSVFYMSSYSVILSPRFVLVYTKSAVHSP